MCTSGEKVHISVEAERVQSVSYSHMRSLSGLYTVVCLREGKRGTCLGPPFATVYSTLLSKGPNRNCNVLVGYFAFKGPQQATAVVMCNLLSKGPKVTVMHKHFSFKGPPNYTDF